MFTNEIAKYLIGLKKKIIDNESTMEEVKLSCQFPIQNSFELISEDDKDYSFLLEINQSKKKISQNNTSSSRRRS